MSDKPIIVAVSNAETRIAAENLLREYLQFIEDTATQQYQLVIDVEAMIKSDLAYNSPFYPPQGRFYVVKPADQYIGVGCLKEIEPGIAELQRMYVRPSARGLGVGRLLLNQLLADAQTMPFHTVRLESLKALTAAHALYRSVGFREINPYAENSMKKYQSADSLVHYRSSAVFMELKLRRD